MGSSDPASQVNHSTRMMQCSHSSAVFQLPDTFLAVFVNWANSVFKFVSVYPQKDVTLSGVHYATQLRKLADWDIPNLSGSFHR